MLKAKGLTVSLGGRTVLSDVSLSVSAGDWLMVAGPNGAGKSTLVRALTGAIPCTGTVTVQGRPLHAMRPGERARHVGVLSQLNAITADFTVAEVVAMGRYAYRRGLLGNPEPDLTDRVRAALDTVGMTDMADRRILSLSGGERQRALLAQVLCQDPAVLILDEPANHLDLPYQRQLLLTVDAWRRRGERAVICVMHDLSIARRWGTHALLLHEGACLANGLAQEVLTPDRLAQVYGMDVAGWLRDLHEGW